MADLTGLAQSGKPGYVTFLFWSSRNIREHSSFVDCNSPT
jgi:hypothetical protein